MNPTLSIWLELSRILAALAVFIGHSAGLGVAPADVIIQWHRSADDAVTAFFVISGLVIAYTTQSSNGTARQYAIARLSRVYSVALPAVLFALAVDHVGMHFDVSQYEPTWQYPKLWLYLPLHWLFLGETWFGAIYPFTVAPYWSLGYEVWYYVLFGCVTFLSGRTRWVVSALVLMVMGPRIWLLLPTWWLGVLLCRQLDRLRVRQGAAFGLMALALVGYGLFLTSGWRGVTDEASQRLYAMFSTLLPVPFNRGSTVHVLSDYVVAVLFAVFLIGCASCRLDFGKAAGLVIRKLAGYTFTFYLIHFTLLVLARALGFSSVGWGVYALILAGVLATTWAMAQIGEQRRGWYRTLFAKAIGKQV
ncbi:acyltransferase family protein [Aquabacterium sp.]|uniref:acyltransferase family protein n=1 Tax=Aquabacterium sp. TaxID=1872578 RepID=UPI0019893A1D|nr:acyltransferase family protein [Aquabacterium sp.]MBC7698923.1 acyltransferase [Aquabacterium sp.]